MIEHLLNLGSKVSGCVSDSEFTSLVCCSCKYYKFCSKNKNLCNHCRI